MKVLTLTDDAPYEHHREAVHLYRWFPGIHNCRSHGLVVGPNDEQIMQDAVQYPVTVYNDHRGLVNTRSPKQPGLSTWGGLRPTGDLELKVIRKA